MGEWEYRDFRLTCPSEITGSIPAESYTGPAARLYYWKNFRTYFLLELQRSLDEGWQPVSEPGPDCIQLRAYRSRERDLVDDHGCVFTPGHAFWGLVQSIAYLIGKRKYELVGFHVRLRRPK